MLYTSSKVQLLLKFIEIDEVFVNLKIAKTPENTRKYEKVPYMKQVLVQKIFKKKVYLLRHIRNKF